MKRWTKYNPQTGDIICTFDGRPGDIELNQPAIEGEYSARLYRVIDGKPVQKSAEEVEGNELQFAMVQFRKRRNDLLSACDWTQAADAPVDHAAWASYRQALRDLPANTADPRDPAWPIPPA
jgi:hypothetical protein